MSELKRHHINEVMDMHNLTRGEMGYSFVYYADDADKVIADLIEKNKRLANMNIIKASETIKDLYKEIRHNKYKRCRVMAIWLKDKIDTIKNGYIVSSIESRDGVMTTCPPECNPKFSFYKKWRKIWFGLAMKFKEVK